MGNFTTKNIELHFGIFILTIFLLLYRRASVLQIELPTSPSSSLFWSIPCIVSLDRECQILLWYYYEPRFVDSASSTNCVKVSDMFLTFCNCVVRSHEARLSGRQTHACNMFFVLSLPFSIRWPVFHYSSSSNTRSFSCGAPLPQYYFT